MKTGNLVYLIVLFIKWCGTVCSLTDESSSAYSSMNSSRGASQSRSNSGNKSTRSERAQAPYQQPKTVANDDEVEQIMHEMAQDFRKSETESGTDWNILLFCSHSSVTRAGSSGSALFC